ncbi:MAG: MFS transporter [Chloroflexota bacterium]
MTAQREAVVQGAHQALGQVREMSHLARSDDPRHWRALAACTLAIIATAIDPPILQATSSGVQGALHVAPEVAASVVGLYYVVQAGFMAAGGVLGDLYGLRRVLLLGLAALIVTSSVTALAGSVPVLLVGHVGLSLASAIVMPLSLACLMRIFDHRVMPVAIAVYLMLQLLASLAGPTMAQALYGRFGFGATLVPSLLVAAIAVPAVRRWVEPLPTGARMSRVDALSLMLWVVGMLMLVYAIVAFAGGWGSFRDLAAFVGIGCLLAAGVRAARGSTRLSLPHIPFRSWASPSGLGELHRPCPIGDPAAALQLPQGRWTTARSGRASRSRHSPWGRSSPHSSRHRARAPLPGGRHRPAPVPQADGRGPPARRPLGRPVRDPRHQCRVPGDCIALGLLGVGAAIANVPRTDLLFRSVRGDIASVWQPGSTARRSCWVRRLATSRSRP